MPNFDFGDKMNDLLFDYDKEKNEDLSGLAFPFTRGEIDTNKLLLPENHLEKWIVEHEKGSGVSLNLIILDKSKNDYGTFDGILVKHTDKGDSIEYVVSVKHDATEDNLILNIPFLSKKPEDILVYIVDVLTPTEIKYYIDLLNRYDISRKLYFDYQDVNIKTHPLIVKIKNKQMKGSIIKTIFKWGFWGVLVFFLSRWIFSR